MSRIRGAAALFLLMMLASCGTGGSGVSASASKSLQRDLDVAKVAVAARNVAVARGALDELTRQTVVFLADHQVDSRAAARIISSVGAVEQQLALVAPATTVPVTTSSSTTTTTTTSTPTTKAPRGRHGSDKKGHGGGD